MVLWHDGRDMTTLEPCQASLDGLSAGDALGTRLFVPGTRFRDLIDGCLPVGCPRDTGPRDSIRTK